MGKTLGNIIAVGFAVGINLVPGVGQAISGVVFGAIGGSLGSAVVGALQLGSLTFGLQAGASLLGLGPNLDKPQTSSIALKPRRQGSRLFEPAGSPETTQ